MPAEPASVGRLAREAHVSVVPGAEAEAVLQRFVAQVVRMTTTGDAERAPEFALVLAVDLDGVVRGGGATVGAHLAGLVVVIAGIDEHALTAEAKFEGEDVAVCVA